jgi:hypothetical protein
MVGDKSDVRIDPVRNASQAIVEDDGAGGFGPNRADL